MYNKYYSITLKIDGIYDIFTYITSTIQNLLIDFQLFLVYQEFVRILAYMNHHTSLLFHRMFCWMEYSLLYFRMYILYWLVVVQI